MGNLQERSIELAWLGGIIDADGSIFIANSQRTVKNFMDTGKTYIYRKVRPKASVVIGNTSHKMIELIAEILDSHRLAHYVYWRKKQYGRGKKRYGSVSILGLRRCYRFLSIMLPYILVKHEQAQTLYDYCKYRLERVEKRQNEPLDDAEINLILKLRALNGDNPGGARHDFDQYPQRLYAGRQPHRKPRVGKIVDAEDIVRT